MESAIWKVAISGLCSFFFWIREIREWHVYGFALDIAKLAKDEMLMFFLFFLDLPYAML